MRFMLGGFQKGNELALTVLLGENLSKTRIPGVYDVDVWFCEGRSKPNLSSTRNVEIPAGIAIDVSWKLIEKFAGPLSRKIRTRFARWRTSRKFRKAIPPQSRIWPLFMRKISADSYIEDFLNQQIYERMVTPSQASKFTWSMINSHVGEIKELCYIRLVSRNEIEKIASDEFDNVIKGSNLVRIYLADRDCLNKMTSTEVTIYNTDKFVKSFIDCNNEIKSRTTPEKTSEARYIGDTISVWGNLCMLREREQKRWCKDKLELYLYKGVPQHADLPTLRGTLLEAKADDKTVHAGVIMLMPERSPGTCSVPVEVLDYYDLAYQEISRLRPSLVNNIQAMSEKYAEEITKACKDWSKMTNAYLRRIRFDVEKITDNNISPIHVAETVRMLQEWITDLDASGLPQI